MLVAVFTAHFLDCTILVQSGVVVFTQSARIKIDDAFELGQLVLNIKHLVDLFLITGHDKPRAAVIQDIGHFFGVGVLVQGHRHSANHLGGHHRPV